MSETKFTPGPWHAEITRSGRIWFSVWNAADKYQVCAGCCDNPKLFDTVVANANLLSAAPEMFQFGESLMPLLVSLHTMIDIPESMHDDLKKRIAQWKEIKEKVMEIG